MATGLNVHFIFMALYTALLIFSVCGAVVYRSGSGTVPLVLWIAVAGASSAGALLQVLMHVRTRQALSLLKNQLKKCLKKHLKKILRKTFFRTWKMR